MSDLQQYINFSIYSEALGFLIHSDLVFLGHMCLCPINSLLGILAKIFLCPKFQIVRSYQNCFLEDSWGCISGICEDSEIIELEVIRSQKRFVLKRKEVFKSLFNFIFDFLQVDIRI